MLIQLIEGGYIAQIVLLVLVWGTIAFLAATGRPLPDPLLDAGFIILGSYFHVLAKQITVRQNGRNTPDS